MNFVPDDFLSMFKMMYLAAFFIPAITSLFYRKIEKRIKMYAISVVTLLIVIFPLMVFILSTWIWTLLPMYIFAGLILFLLFWIQLSFTRWWISDKVTTKSSAS